MMNGIVLAYTKDVFAGVIQARDGKKYCFHRKDWPGAADPKKGSLVEFKPSNRMALEIRHAVPVAA